VAVAVTLAGRKPATVPAVGTTYAELESAFSEKKRFQKLNIKKTKKAKNPIPASILCP
jgi:hypothetical protein